MQQYDYKHRYVWRNPPRTTTRAQWRIVSKYLRDCRRAIWEKASVAVKLMDNPTDGNADFDCVVDSVISWPFAEKC